MLTFLNLKQDLYRLTGVTTATVRADIKEAVRLAILQGQQLFCHHGDWGFLEQYRDTVYIPLSLPYSTGTVTVTQDSKTVAGVSTVWTAAMAGQYFRLTSKEYYEIQSVESATSLTLAIPYQFDDAATQTYEIMRKFYDLPLDLLRADGEQARLNQPGFASEWILGYDTNCAVRDYPVEGKPDRYAVIGNSRGEDYYAVGTCTIATTSGVSTWTMGTATLPTDIVDREVRLAGEDRAYKIKTRSAATTLTTRKAYVNPSDGTATQATASSYAITPADTKQICFDKAPSENRYIVTLPYIKKLPELIADSDVSAISLAGYDEALIAVCRSQLAIDGRTSMRADLVQGLFRQRDEALARAWSAEQYSVSKQLMSESKKARVRQAAPSWIQN